MHPLCAKREGGREPADAVQVETATEGCGMVSERYLRNCSALSEEECAMLGDACVAVAGCGGLGGSVVEALARVGVGHLRVIDCDAFEPTNLNRQLLCTEATVGRRKVEVAAERIHAVNGGVVVEAIDAALTEGNAFDLLAGADCVVDCLDSLEARFWAGRACQELGIPIVYGAVAGWFGQACTVHPGDPSFSVVYGAIGRTSAHETLGTLPFAAHAVAAVQAAEAVKVLLGREGQLRNRLLAIDLLDGSVDDIDIG